MSTRLAILAGFALSLLLTATVHAQSLLERLEKRIAEAQPAGQVPPDPQPPAPAKKPQEEAPPAEGRPGFLGLTADVKNGALEVISVRAGGPSDAAGLKPGDKLVSVGGVPVANLSELGELVGDLPAGSAIELVVGRGGKQQKIKVTLAAREGEVLPAPRGGERDPFVPREVPLNEAPAALGVRALAATPEIVRKHGLLIRRGAVIESIQAGSAADRYGLPIGAAITAIDGARVDSPDDLAAHIGARRPGDTIELSYYVRDQIYRKKVRLAPAGEVAAAPAEDRPILRRLERALDDVIPVPIEREPAAAPARLQSQLDAMRSRMEDLEARLAELEAKLAAAEAKSGKPKPELTPPLKPLDP